MLPPELIQKLKDQVRAGLDDSIQLYKHFHANAELSSQEERTAARVAAEFDKLGIPAATGIGGHGVVGLLENGEGPTVMLRADMDALPIKEETGLDYACGLVSTSRSGDTAPVMHACGHDIHTTNLIGTAGLLAGLKEHWKGTVVFIAQPAEEGLNGAKAMVDDGLWERFPRPDFGLALHVFPEFATGQVGFVSGYALAGAESLDLVVKGLGGHGAQPHKAKDPVVLTAQIILALQTLVSRSIDPREAAVITAGAIHGGTKRNIIPEEVVLNLTVRAFSQEVMDKLVSGIQEAAEGLARAMGFPEDLLPTLSRSDSPLPAVYNEPELVERISGMFGHILGEGNISPAEPVTGSEDFGQLAETDPPFPLFMYMIGCIEQARMEEAEKTGAGIAQLHTPRFYPDPPGTLETGLTTLTAAALELLGKG